MRFKLTNERLLALRSLLAGPLHPNEAYIRSLANRLVDSLPFVPLSCGTLQPDRLSLTIKARWDFKYRFYFLADGRRALKETLLAIKIRHIHRLQLLDQPRPNNLAINLRCSTTIDQFGLRQTCSHGTWPPSFLVELAREGRKTGASCIAPSRSMHQVAPRRNLSALPDSDRFEESQTPDGGTYDPGNNVHQSLDQSQYICLREDLPSQEQEAFRPALLDTGSMDSSLMKPRAA